MVFLLIMLFNILGFLKSRYLYFSLKLSFATSSSLISNGKALDLLKISILLANTSISPVSNLGFLEDLSCTKPVTFKTYSFLISLTKSVRSSLTKICVIPYLSRKSINANDPRLRIVDTQPERVTVLPQSAIHNSFSLFVLYIL